MINIPNSDHSYYMLHRLYATFEAMKENKYIVRIPHAFEVASEKNNPTHEKGRNAKDVMEQKRNCSVNPPSEQDFCTRIRRDRSTKAQTSRARRAVLQLDIVCRHDMREHGFHLVCSKETSRAIGQSDLCIGDEEMKTTCQACLPCPKGR
jgi:hypothetical protein